MIYLASPYFHSDPAVMQARYEAAVRAAGKLIADGVHVFSPIVHNHPVRVESGRIPGDHKFWLDYDRWFLEKCSKLIVLKLDGWQDSVGVGDEVSYANDRHIPVEFMNPIYSFQVGDRVRKVKGARYAGEVVSVFTVPAGYPKAGETLINVINADGWVMHFGPHQLEKDNG